MFFLIDNLSVFEKDGRSNNMSKHLIDVDFKEEFCVCPTCGYQDGFHSVFRRNHSEVKWLLICPACHDTFDIGLTADIKINNR